MVRRLLESRGLALGAALLAIGLVAPSLATGLQTEDFVHREASRRALGLPNLFGIGGAPVMASYAAIDAGTLPWISAPGLRLSFWRPLASFSHHLDYRVFGDAPWVAHLHSLLWFALLLVAGLRLYRRLAGNDPLWPAWAAGLAALLYALDDGHGTAVGWLANRNAVMAAALGLLAVEAHDRWRRDGWAPGGVTAPALLLGALLAGEIGAGALGFFAAHFFTLDPAPWRRRALALVPWLGATALWAAAYRLGGHGAYASGAYLDPASEPLRFLRASAERLPLLLGGQLWGVPTELLHALVPGRPWVVTASAGLVVAFGLVLLPVVRASAVARFWALAALLAALPACGTLPSDRLLFFAGVAGMGLVAALVARLAEPRTDATRAWRRAALPVAALLLVAHGPVAAVLLPLRAVALERPSRWLEAASESAFSAVQSPRQHLVIVSAPDFYAGTLLVALRAASGQPLPERARVLYGGTDALQVTREDERTLLLRPARGFLASPFNRVYRGRGHPMHAGQGLQLFRLQILVREVDERGAPHAVAFRFSRSLGPPWFAFVAWDGERYAPWTPPPVGASVVIEARFAGPGAG